MENIPIEWKNLEWLFPSRNWTDINFKKKIIMINNIQLSIECSIINLSNSTGWWQSPGDKEVSEYSRADNRKGNS